MVSVIHILGVISTMSRSYSFIFHWMCVGTLSVYRSYSFNNLVVLPPHVLFYIILFSDCCCRAVGYAVDESAIDVAAQAAKEHFRTERGLAAGFIRSLVDGSRK
jgi:hypothetical protein